ncbi:MAG: glutamate-5-semialdehyde dehydrogenase [Clostridia bacterium]|nr:glutamate-5-semialdehyde dehydrogenase [Clostridia bacterium]
MEQKSTTIALCERAKAASYEVAALSDEKINGALTAMAEALIENTDKILSANDADIEAAKATISTVMLDRLRLTPERIRGMADGILEITALPSPLGVTLERTSRPNGLLIEKVSVPMGVIAIIYESRPNVTSDAAALALKSGSACVLRGGKEAYRSASAIVEALKSGLAKVGVTPDAVNLVSDTTRASATELMRAQGLVDLLIPRGGAGLIRACVENATVPCLETGTGICHVYVDKSANLDKAIAILENAKTSRPSVCNACEVCLVHKEVAEKFLPMVKRVLSDKREEEGKQPVELRLDGTALGIINGTPASDADFDTEFLDYILGVKVVESIDEAIAHITAHSTHHSEAIISEDEVAQSAFTARVDSAAVYINASTRFTDGGEFGLGCEMGISTQKMHARGPLGIRELTTYKYIIRGNGQIR